jgi:D-proline reductase (dithiol) PrdB
MPRLDRLPEILRNTLLTLPVQINETAPFTRLRKPLAESKLAIVTTTGIHLRTDAPFVTADPSYRVLPSSARQEDILQSHASIGFDRTPTYRDLNVVYPVDRVRELAERGEIGSLAENYYSFMGAQRDATRIQETSAPEVAQRLLDEGVDVALITPT